MAERSSLNQVSQIGVEVTPGTAVSVTRRLQSISIEPSPAVEVDTFRPAGQKVAALVNLTKEWTEGSIEGRPAYNELPYLFSSVLTKGTVTTPDAAAAPTLRRWEFEPSSTEDDSPVTFTIQHGSSVRAAEFPYALLTEMGMSISRSSLEISGSMMGRAMTDNVPLTTSGVETLDLIPVLPGQMKVFMDLDHTALGTTKMTRNLSSEWSIGNRFGPLWVVDADQDSYAAVMETEPDVSASMTVEADQQGMGILDHLREGQTVFVRFQAEGAPVGDGTVATNRYLVQIDMALKVSDTGGYSDEDGAFAVEWSFTGVHDSDWGRYIRVVVQNELEAL